MIRTLLIFVLIAAPIALSYMLVPHHEAGDHGIFVGLFMHLMPAQLEWNHQPLGIPLPEFLSVFTWAGDIKNPVVTGILPLTNLQLFQVAAVLLIFACFSGVPACIRTGQGDYVSRLFAGFVLWVRDEMVYPVMGKPWGDRFLPLFLIIFFFILFMNLLGLVPGSATATASWGATGAMAVVTFSLMIFGGMAVQGPFAFWKNLIPHGVPLVFVPVLAVVEVVGLVVKPVALTIRLFANMTAGHLIVLSAMGMIFLAGTAGSVVAYGTAPLTVGFGVFIMIIESFVACLQAYIFTYLSILFVYMSIHPEH